MRCSSVWKVCFLLCVSICTSRDVLVSWNLRRIPLVLLPVETRHLIFAFLSFCLGSELITEQILWWKLFGRSFREWSEVSRRCEPGRWNAPSRCCLGKRLVLLEGERKKSKDRIIKSKAVGTKMFVGVLFSEYLYEKGNRTQGKYTPNMNSWFVKRKHQPTNQPANTLEILRLT